MKPINFVGPIKNVEVYSFTKRAYGFEADMEGNRKLELRMINKLTLPTTTRITITNCRTNIAGEYI